MKNKIFVYGTLMKGMSNYDYYLSKTNFLGNAEINGYIMYDLDSYPGIIEGNGKIKGEVYEVDDNTLQKIDTLENEGNFYKKRLVPSSLGDVYVYIYNYPIKNKNIIPYEMQPYNKLIYYVSYGSNMLEERFLCYIKGGFCRYNNRYYYGCQNKCLPIKTKSIIIPYNMFYSKESSTWDNKPVSFLDYSKEGSAYAKAYLITEEQFKTVQEQEGAWYDKKIELKSIDGFKVYTFTSSNEKLEHRHYTSLSDNYKKVLQNGLKQSFPLLSEEEINNYLMKCSN